MKRSKVNTKALFANLKIKRDAARTTKLAELDARIAGAEVSALAVLDHYETSRRSRADHPPAPKRNHEP